MIEETDPAPRPSGERRDRVTTQLCDHFAAGHIELDELEARLAEVDRAASDAELDALVSELPALPGPPPVELARREAGRHGFALAVLGGSTRKGQWTPSRNVHAFALMGGVELDFREARMPPGETHVTAVALMGGIEIKVPPGLPVEVRGVGIMGAVDQLERGAESEHPAVPRLKVTAVACMGGVEVKTLERGVGAGRRRRPRGRGARD